MVSEFHPSRREGVVWYSQGQKPMVEALHITVDQEAKSDVRTTGWTTAFEALSLSGLLSSRPHLLKVLQLPKLPTRWGQMPKIRSCGGTFQIQAMVVYLSVFTAGLGSFHYYSFVFILVSLRIK